MDRKTGMAFLEALRNLCVRPGLGRHGYMDLPCSMVIATWDDKDWTRRIVLERSF